MLHFGLKLLCRDAGPTVLDRACWTNRATHSDAGLAHFSTRTDRLRFSILRRPAKPEVLLNELFQNQQ